MPRVVHFTVPADDIARARKFYSEVFGWSLSKWEGPMEYWIAKTGEDKEPGINGGIAEKSPMCPVTVNTIEVPSVEEYAEKIITGGGKVVMGIPVKGVGHFAHCTDTEGNRFDIVQLEKKAG